MVEMVKLAGAVVATTSNATRVDKAQLERQVDSKVYDVAFSLAGPARQNNDASREGASMEGVQRSVNMLHTLKEQKSSATPVVRIAYLFKRSDLPDLSLPPRQWVRIISSARDDIRSRFTYTA